MIDPRISLSTMNPRKIEDDLFPNQILQLHHHHHHHDPIQDASPFSLPEIVLFHDDDDPNDSPATPSSSDADDPPNPSHHHPPSAAAAADSGPSSAVNHPPIPYINPQPHISSQFYTFNSESHALMIRCILERRLATPDEIRSATPDPVLLSWRSVWKDRNEDTAYLTAWKRIQDKLSAHVDAHGNEFLCFKNNSHQFVSHINQWQAIVMTFHGDTDLKHLGAKETIERIKQVWTVGAKLYGIPESFIRVCVASCPLCSGSSGSGARTKRRRFEYTESIDVPAKEVPHRLQQLAAKHKVVLCIRQKYIRYKPFMAEVKDYACHRAGEPTAKKSRILKREPYASKRCGCGFRIRAIVPISNYNEKDKSFVYDEEGTAVFKLYAVHSGHEPGPLDGNARIMHRMVGHKGGFIMDQDTVYGVREDAENDSFGLMRKGDGNLQHSVIQQLQELRVEVGLLEGKLVKIPQELLGSVSRELYDVLNKVRSIGEGSANTINFASHKQQCGDALVGETDLAHWGDQHHERLYRDDKEGELIEQDEDIEDSFGQALGDVAAWDSMETECRIQKDQISNICKSEKWLHCSEFDEKSILNSENTKLTKPIQHDETMVTDVGLVGIQVDGFYPENAKWYESSCILDAGADCGDTSFRHGEML